MTAFGLGAMPGTNLEHAADVALSETPLPHLPQLPGRGLGSDLIGRTAALLPIYFDKGPRSWRVTPRPQILTRRAADQMERDLDVLEELWAGKLTSIKVQLVGPWTLSAEIEMANGHRMLSDHGALNDLTDALLEAAQQHVSKVARRFDADVVLQLDEPRLNDIRIGQVPGTTDFDTIGAVRDDDILARLALFGPHLLHTTAPLFRAPWITVNLASLTTSALLDAAGFALEQGHTFAIAAQEPKKVGEIVDKLNIDPTLTKLDVYAEAADTLQATAHNYAKARECDEILQRDFLS
ncbi:methionine synthase [Corynebacterium cystitidis]|uniref:Cobalamin-independent synthase, Catalytic domain n=1 Tax=Corynebacterium cystitidis DSM 20524 TaxID=1121357 RepID=A0A1H9S3Z6_9CORY|nr:methionine synthase [Corynebacterium cystitidis]WJY82203.1 hypothetical protein CCYS_06350 [Corynebacterium cystitidis DSM 20524]SER79710.1 hypothetical protein SAMN05661109_01045 [Corynebacterium cystitidis DSM 20524]SNV77883.1 Uncharacterised protein [Corynebacterium cystitidis]